MDNKWIVLGAAVVGVVIIAIFAFLWFFGTHNFFVGLEKNVEEKQANLEAQYQRRVDLIPNVVATVKGATGFEQSTLEEITRLRSQWQTQPEQRLETANQIESTLSKILSISENYPELRATEQFQTLIVELEGTENRISFARQEFNASIKQYNTELALFPGSFVAGFYGFKEKKFFQAEEGADKAPKVDFG